MKKLLNIMLVDDDDICNFISRKTIEISGICGAVQTASSAIKALEMLDQASKGALTMPDIIFVDLNMPVMDGFEFMEAFQRLELKNKDRISIVMLTSSDNLQDRQRARELGILHYLIKPLMLQHLRSLIYILNSSRSQRYHLSKK